jgi:Uma2 family endonuclease
MPASVQMTAKQFFEFCQLQPLQEKMLEYVAERGCRLGWLIDRKHCQVYVYRPGQPVDCLQNLERLDADPELPGFCLDLRKIW